MESIRKVKKLLKRYPVMIEMNIPEYIHAQQMEDMYKQMQKRFGNNVILMILPQQPFPVVIKADELTEEAKQKFKEQLNDTKQNSSYVVGIDPAYGVDDSFVTIFKRDQFKIHSCFKLTAKQHNEIIEAVKEHKVTTSIK